MCSHFLTKETELLWAGNVMGKTLPALWRQLARPCFGLFGQEGDISFLQKLVAAYPAARELRLPLDKHPAHISKETQGYLESGPQRFIFIFYAQARFMAQPCGEPVRQDGA